MPYVPANLLLDIKIEYHLFDSAPTVFSVFIKIFFHFAFSNKKSMIYFLEKTQKGVHHQ